MGSKPILGEIKTKYRKDTTELIETGVSLIWERHWCNSKICKKQMCQTRKNYSKQRFVMKIMTITCSDI